MPGRNIPRTSISGPSQLVERNARRATNAVSVMTWPAPLLLLGFLELFVPRHLDRFELRLVRRLGVVVETLEREHLLPEIGETNGQRIDVRKLLLQRDGDVFRVGPLQGVT